MIFDKFVDAWDRKDAEAELALFHDDWEFKFHSSGNIMKKGDMSLDDRKKMMENHQLENRRCLYENDDVLVMHWISHFPNGTSDAVMMVHRKKRGPSMAHRNRLNTSQQRLTSLHAFKGNSREVMWLTGCR